MGDDPGRRAELNGFRLGRAAARCGEHLRVHTLDDAPSLVGDSRDHGDRPQVLGAVIDHVKEGPDTGQAEQDRQQHRQLRDGILDSPQDSDRVDEREDKHPQHNLDGPILHD
jgi:hypothetical protein